jgi:tetratricopeptide (TPR) repeat protein
MSETLAWTVGPLLVPDNFTVDDEAERRSLGALRQRLADRLAGTCDDVVAALSQPDLAADAPARAVQQLVEAMAADKSLAADLSSLLDQAVQADHPGASLVLRMRADASREGKRYDEALAAYDEILRRNPDDAGALYWSAVTLRLLNRREDALARLRMVSALRDVDAEDQVLVAQQFLLLEERDDAVAAARKAKELAKRTPLSAESALNAGELWADLGDPEEAVAVLMPLLEADGEPGAVEVTAYLLAARLMLVEIGDGRRVVDLLTRLEKRLGSLADQPVARMWLGHALSALDRNAQALEYLDERLADQVPPELRGWTLFGRGQALVGNEEPGQAESLLREAIPLLQGVLRAVAELMLGIALIGLGRRDEAREVLDRAEAAVAQANPVLQGRVALWRAVAWSNDETKLREGLKRADDLLPPEWPERNILSYWQAKALAGSDPKRALSLIDSIATPHPAWLPDLAMTRATALVALDRPDDALTALQPVFVDAGALSTDQRAWIWTMRANLFLRLGEPKQAIEALADVQDSALADDKLANWFLGLQAGAASALGNRELLDAVFTQMADRDPSFRPMADYVHAETVLLHGDPAKAYKMFRLLEEPKDPSNALEWVVAASVRQVAGRVDVEQALDRAVELNAVMEANPIVRMTRAMLAMGRGDLDAIDAYEAQASTPDQRIMAHYLRAAALRQLDRRTEAIGELEAVEAEARQMTSGLGVTLHAQALADKAVLLLLQDDVAEAEQAVAQAEALLPTLPPGGTAVLATRMARGLLHIKREEHAKADKELADAAAVASSFPAHTRLAFVIDYVRGVNWMTAGPDAAEDALRWLISAVNREPEDPDAQAALGQTYLVLEDPAAALDAFAKALSVGSGSKQTTSLLRGKATAQRHLGHLEAAVTTAREAATREPAEALNWLTLGASQLELGRDDAAAIAFRRGWGLRPRPSDRIATQLVLGLTKALLDEDRADDALKVVDDPLAQRLAEKEHLIHLNRAVALIRLARYDEGAEALVRANRSEDAEQLRENAGQRRALHSRRDSWLGFWFGAAVPLHRRRLGALFVVAAVFALMPILINSEKVSWLSWVATGNIRPLVPLAIIALLFLLPVVIRIKFGEVEVEVEQPEPAAPTATEVKAVGWDAVERKVQSISTPQIMGKSTDALPPPKPATAPAASATASSIAVVAGQQLITSS